METETLEGIAREALESTCASAPVDAFGLADALGLTVRAWPGHGALLDYDGASVFLTTRPTRPTRQHGLVAHELGHFLLREHREQDDELAARYLAGALIVPREELDRDLRRLGLSIVALRAKHVNASHEMIARRITQLRSAIVTIIDDGRVTARAASPWLPVPRPQVPPWELDLAARAIESREEVRHGETVATPAIAGSRRRALIVARAA